MHLVVIRREVYDANPWIAASLCKAFEAAKAWALDEMRFSGAQRYMLPWLFADLDEVDELFGGDPWPYGVEANRPTLEAYVRYMVDQKFIAETMPIESFDQDPRSTCSCSIRRPSTPSARLSSPTWTWQPGAVPWN